MSERDDLGRAEASEATGLDTATAAASWAGAARSAPTTRPTTPRFRPHRHPSQLDDSADRLRYRRTVLQMTILTVDHR